MSGKISFVDNSTHEVDFILAKRGVNSNDYFILTVQIPVIHRINSIISANLVNLKYYSTSI